MGLVLIVGVALTMGNGSLQFQHGGALLVAGATAVTLIGLLDGGSAVARLCSTRSLVWVGKVSYGAYLYHWPIFSLSGSHWGPVHGTWLALAQLLTSFACAGVSYRWLEQPVMRRRWLPSRRIVMGAWAAAVAVLVAGVIMWSGLGAEAKVAFANAGSGVPSPMASDPTGSPVPSVSPAVDAQTVARAKRPLRVIVTGDSTAEVIAWALRRYEVSHPDELQLLDLSLPGCTITPVAAARHYRGEPPQDMSKCGLWIVTFPGRVEAFQPDVAVAFISMMEQADQRTQGSSVWQNVLDPAWADHQLQQYRHLADLLSGTGAPVLWADVPYMKFQPRLPFVSDQPQRTDALNVLFRRLQAEDPEVTLLEYAARLNRLDHSVDTKIRPDGIHLGDAVADETVSTWLVPALKEAKPPH
jgi:hypothetical protein